MEKEIITYYFNIVRRWLWLLLLTTLIAVVTTYWQVAQQPSVYEAKVRLIVGPGIDSANPDLNALRTGGQLMQTYAELATMRSILRIVIDDLGLDMKATKLENNIEVKTNEEAQILTISVQDGNREQAGIVANGVAEVLVRLSPSRSDNPDAKLKDQMRSQAVKVESSIVTIETLIEQLEADLQVTNNEMDQRRIVDQLSKERGHLSDANRTLAFLYDSLQEASPNQVKVIEPATDGKRVDPQIQLRMIISAGAGLVLGLVIALALEYLDDTIKTVDDLVRISGIPLLGIISKYKISRQRNHGQLAVQALPDSVAAENFRMLGTKLLSKNKAPNQNNNRRSNVSDVQQLSTRNTNGLDSILISSLQPDDDAGEIAANLAVVLAQTGQQVVLVDASLHRPTIGPLFNITDQEGLTATLMADSKAPKLVPIELAPGLCILPGGPVPPNPFELLASPNMADLIEQLKKQADIVIIAGSSLLSFADSLVLASRVDEVVVVARCGKSHRRMIRAASDNLRSLQVNVVGVIFDLNRSSQVLKPSRTWVPYYLQMTARISGKSIQSLFIKFPRWIVTMSKVIKPVKHKLDPPVKQLLDMSPVDD